MVAMDDGFPEYLVHAWSTDDVWVQEKGTPYLADFQLMEVQGTNSEGTEFYVTETSENGVLECAKTIDDGDVAAHGTLKWDGCFNFAIANYEHTCNERQYEQWLKAMRLCRQLCAEIVQPEDF